VNRKVVSAITERQILYFTYIH